MIQELTTVSPKFKVVVQSKSFIHSIFISAFVAVTLTACGGGSSGGSSPPPPSVGSSLSSSGSTGLYSVDGVSYALTPSSGSSANLVQLPNTGDRVAALSVAQVSMTPITTSLATVSGTSVDPASDLGVAYDYNETKISFFKLSTKKEISTFDTQTTTPGDYSGASPYIANVLMDVDSKVVIAGTGDGFDFISYANPLSWRTLLLIQH